jgi:hypothetical protein
MFDVLVTPSPSLFETGGNITSEFTNIIANDATTITKPGTWQLLCLGKNT